MANSNQNLATIKTDNKAGFFLRAGKKVRMIAFTAILPLVSACGEPATNYCINPENRPSSCQDVEVRKIFQNEEKPLCLAGTQDFPCKTIYETLGVITINELKPNLENPVKLPLKITYTCKKCTDKKSIDLVVDSVEGSESQLNVGIACKDSGIFNCSFVFDSAQKVLLTLDKGAQVDKGSSYYGFSDSGNAQVALMINFLYFGGVLYTIDVAEYYCFTKTFTETKYGSCK